MPYLPPATAAVRSGVRELLTERLTAGALAPGDLVLVACSGGADSLALAVATAFVAPRLGLRAGALSVDHGLQPGSETVGREAIAQCRALGLDPAWMITPDGDAHAGSPGVSTSPEPLGAAGPEGRARAIRYGAFEAAIAETGAAAVLLGHTADDQAETVLLGLARGSGTRALAGMAPVRGHYLRPLLAVSRGQTEQACAEVGLKPWHDPTNAPDGPWRTASGAALPRAAVRAEVLPALTRALGPGVIEALGRTAELTRADADLLDEMAEALLARARADAGSTAPATVEDEQRDGRSTGAGERGGVSSAVGGASHDGRSGELGNHGGVSSAVGGASHDGRTGEPSELAGVSPAVVLHVATLIGEPPALRSRALRTAALAAGSPAGSLNHGHIRAVDALLTDYRGQGPISLPGPVWAARQYGTLVLDARAPAERHHPPPATEHRSGEMSGRHHDG